MSRFSQNTNNANVTAAMLESMYTKENQYKEGSNVNHTLGKTAATRLAISGDLETLLVGMAKEGVLEEDELQAFLTEQRDRLKQLAETNVQSSRRVETLCAALKTLKAKVLSEPEETSKDYNARIQQEMQNETQNRQSMLLESTQEQTYREICTALGEKLTNDDEDIEVMPTGSLNNLKCPIMGSIMENPVKNKVCGHVYSSDGIRSLVARNKRNCKCPVPGCRNANVTLAQLEEDMETSYAVRREKRRQQSQQQNSQADFIESDQE